MIRKDSVHDDMDIGVYIRRLKKEAGVTNKEIAEATQYQTSMIQKITRKAGGTRDPNYAFISEVAEFFNLNDLKPLQVRFLFTTIKSHIMEIFNCEDGDIATQMALQMIGRLDSSMTELPQDQEILLDYDSPMELSLLQENYGDQIDAVKELKKGNNLTPGMKLAQSVVDQLATLVKQCSRIDLLELYFYALFELCWYRLIVTPDTELAAATGSLLQEMRHIYQHTGNQHLRGLLALIKGDILQTLTQIQPNLHQRAYHELQIAGQLVTDPAKILETVLRKKSRIVAEFGTKQQFEKTMSESEDALDRYTSDVPLTMVGIAFQGMSRAYAAQFQRTGLPAHARLAAEKHEEFKNVLEKARMHGDTYGNFHIRIAKGWLILDQLKIIDLGRNGRISIATEARDRAASMGDRRIISEVDTLLAMAR